MIKMSNNSFKELSLAKLIETLSLTIKKDDTNKLVTFLALLSAYTENSQFNISFNDLREVKSRILWRINAA